MGKFESLANIVFARTEKGVNACNTRNKELPRQLKSLLLVVDGQASVSKFVPFLTNLLPLSEKFTELELAGYIHRKNPTLSSQFDHPIKASNDANQFENQSANSEKIDPIVSNALREIENFLAMNAGIEALPIITKLSNIKTFEHLKLELPAYFDLIESYDIDAASHALRLEKILL